MPRQTPAQLRAETIDLASALFARQGLRNTSLQQIADAVGYSKAGLLHYFPGKDAIYHAAISTARDQIILLSDRAMSEPRGLERDRALVVAAVELTYEWPGVALLVNRLSEQDDQEDPLLVEAAELLATAFGLDAEPSADRIARVLIMAAGVTAAATAAAQVDMKREWRTPIITAAMNTLGHRS